MITSMQIRSRIGAELPIHRLLTFVFLLFIATPADAQRPYVTAGLGIDISRLDQVEGAGISDIAADGETISLLLRLGTAITERWGVEIAFTRPAEITEHTRQGFPIALAGAVLRTTDAAGVSGTAVFDSEIRLARRNNTLDTVVWVAQPISPRANLVYLGGVAFSRTSEALEFTFGGRPIGVIVPTSMTTTNYGVDPTVGVEGRIRLTDHVLLVPGLRMQSTGANDGRNGWLVRAATGLSWQF